MSRVAWSRYGGEDIEAVVAMFVNRERTRSTRITPSRGDGGVDILDRNAEDNGGDVVYQVKRYTKALTSDQKQAVKASLARLMEDPRWKTLKVHEWRLVTPWDPYPEEENWLQDVGQEHGVRAVWHGLAYVEQLAAKYSDVIDYYLNGRNAEIVEMAKTLAAHFSTGGSQDGLSVQEVSEQVKRALQVLDKDPHYRYEHRFGQGALPGPSERPGLVLSYLRQNTTTTHWIIVDVIALCAASVTERPISVTGALSVEPGSDFEKTFRDFVTYGAGFTSPKGAYDGELDAPGGLGGRLVGATMTAQPPPDLGDNRELHLEVLDPDGALLGAVDLNRVERTQGQGGVRVVLEEINQVFTLEDKLNVVDQVVTRTVEIGEMIGKPVAAVQPALSFLSHCHEPNSGRLSIRHTPAHLGAPDNNIAILVDDDDRREVTALARQIETLVALQQHTGTLITVPDPRATTRDQIRGWLFAAALFRGETVTAKYAEGRCVIVELDASVAIPNGTFSITSPLNVEVGQLVLSLGTVDVELPNPTLLRRQEATGRVRYQFTTPERVLRYRIPAVGDAERVAHSG